MSNIASDVVVDELQAAQRALRIAVVTETYPPEVNGVSLTIARVVEGLRDRGHDLQLIRPRQQADDQADSGERFHEMLLRGLPIPRYPHLKMGLPAKPTLTALAIAGSLAAVAPAAASAGSTISSPTDNIVCQLRSTTMLQCDVKSDGLGINFSAYGSPKYTGRHYLSGGRTIPYGTSITSKHFKCTSLVSGMRCVERHTGRGIFLSRGGNSYRI